MINGSGIYQIVNTVNGKRYIGSAVNFRRRWKVHKTSLRCNKHHSQLLQRAWNKHGESNFKFEILFTCEKEELLEYEQLYLDEYKPEYNICKVAGSTLGMKMPDDVRAKISIIRTNISDETRKRYSDAKKNTKHSAETRLKMSIAHSGEKNHFFNKTHNEESKAKIAEASRRNKNFLNHKHSEESKIKIGNASKGRVLTEENLLKLLEGAKIRNAKLKSGEIKVSEETRAKMSAAKKGRKVPNESIVKLEKTRALNRTLKKAEIEKSFLAKIDVSDIICKHEELEENV